MKLSSGECSKFVQVALPCKLDVIYLKSISHKVSDHISGNVPKSRCSIFDYRLGKLSSAFKPYGYKI